MTHYEDIQKRAKLKQLEVTFQTSLENNCLMDYFLGWLFPKCLLCPAFEVCLSQFLKSNQRAYVSYIALVKNKGDHVL